MKLITTGYLKIWVAVSDHKKTQYVAATPHI